jgi:putative CocE/NonD family hydrolase
MEWLVKQPWCNGAVGTMGLSYGAHTQNALACLNPPGLACMFMDSGGFSSAYHGGIRQGGAFELKQATWAYRHALLSPKTSEDPIRRRNLEKEDIRAWFDKMPWSPGHSPLKAAPEYESYLFEQWRSGLFNDDWKHPEIYAEGHYDQYADVPIAIMGSWYDPYVRTCLTNYTQLSERKQGPIHLIMGPWLHGQRSFSFSGDVDFGAKAILDGNLCQDYFSLRLAWFDRWLKGKRTSHSTFDQPITYFTMGGGSGTKNSAGRLSHGGKWRASDRWPVIGASQIPFYLHADGSLSKDKPKSNGQSIQTPSPYVEYQYDPKNPVPTIGGTITSGDPVMVGGAFDQREDHRFLGAKMPGRPLSDREDVVCFQTPPLDRDVEVSGDVIAHLWISSDCPDTDFTFKLIDVYPSSDDYPEGYCMNITDGICRVRYREGWDREVFMEPGETVEIEIEAFATSNLFKKGHSIRVDISSSNFPHFDINPNTGAPEGVASDCRVATNRVYLSPERPSHVLLSLIEHSEFGG